MRAPTQKANSRHSHQDDINYQISITLYGVCNIIYMCVWLWKFFVSLTSPAFSSLSPSNLLRHFPISEILDVILYNKWFSIHEHWSPKSISINKKSYRGGELTNTERKLNWAQQIYARICKLKKRWGVLSISRRRRAAALPPFGIFLGISYSGKKV